ncbi:MAG TPA: orotidine-5'-phosphate decarboxylase [Dermatophilaceae bacterium]|nr:orotidine-5'-phosphate decarboxylase [Dermatophilaceae bacterium]
MTGPGHPPFGARLRAAMQAHGPLCAGIDPHASMLADWGLSDTPAGLETFALRCVEAFAGQVACVKPQSAFFERFGSAGIAVLERVLADCRDSGTLAILDVKRGDIGSTMDGYAQAYLGPRSPLRADAMTLSPFLGYGSLRPALDLAARTGRGVFVLALTSNPEGPGVQHATPVTAETQPPAGSVAGRIVAGAAADNAEAGRAGVLGSVGLVVGATVGDAVADLGLDLAGANAPLLAPGVGAQGGTAADLRRVFGPALTNVLASSSREVLAAGPQVEELRQAAGRTAAALRGMLSGDEHPTDS